MKCKHCHGTGKIQIPTFDDAMPLLDETCHVCNGTGYVTNYNWLKESDINDQAKWLSTITYACMRCGLNNGKGYCPFGKCIIEKEDALIWLQDEYHDNM